MEKLMKDPNVLMVGAGLIAFLGVRYLLKKKGEEEKSNFSYSKLRTMRVPNRGGFGVNVSKLGVGESAPCGNLNSADCKKQCEPTYGTYNPDGDSGRGSCEGMHTAGFNSNDYITSRYSSACGCGA